VIELAAHRCVRYRSTEATCDACAHVCPTKAITPLPTALSIDEAACIDCGACMGVCPTEALSLPHLLPIDFAFSFLQSDEEIISCKKNFACLAGLGSEYLVALGLGKKVVLDVGHCGECEIKEPCFGAIEEQVARANYVLEAIDRDPIEAKPLAVEPASERREFFSTLAKGAARLKREFGMEEEGVDTQKIRQKELPPKRKLLRALLAQTEPPAAYRYLENEHLDFISDKEIDQRCDNCSICYRLCPTGALFGSERGDRILFRAIDCVRCGLCHDVCAPKSIGFSDYFDTKELFEPEVKELARFNLVRCEDCGAWYTYLGEDEMLCPRCRAEESDAKELWGL